MYIFTIHHFFVYYFLMVDFSSFSFSKPGLSPPFSILYSFFSIKISMNRRFPFGAFGIVWAISSSSWCSCFSFSSSSYFLMSSFSFSSSSTIFPSSFFFILEMIPNAKAFLAAYFFCRCCGIAYLVSSGFLGLSSGLTGIFNELTLPVRVYWWLPLRGRVKLWLLES